MPDTFLLEIATPEKLLVCEPVTEAQIPAESGYLGILPGHAPLLAELGIGELSYSLATGQRHHLGVHGGWIEVTGNNVRVMAHTAEHPDSIDAARAEAALQRAVDRVHRPQPGIDIARALNALRRAQTRVKITGQRLGNSR
ncbi:MAG: ATP synthase F1 subunit epsilon [Bryobacterales bacterium]|nr:ATP synthase F1 subunit epsilon [Bryobacterales bacterium]